MSDIEYLRRDNGLHVLKANANGEYKANCLCHACEKSKNMSPLSICPILAKLWAISSEHRVIVSVPECTSFECDKFDKKPPPTPKPTKGMKCQGPGL